MQTINNNSVLFSSTHIPSMKIPISKPLDLIDTCFELKCFSNTTVQKVRDKINLGQAGVILDKKGGFTLVGKDREADEFIASQMKKGNITHTYVQDTPETKFEGPIIDLTI